MKNLALGMAVIAGILGVCLVWQSGELASARANQADLIAQRDAAVATAMVAASESPVEDAELARLLANDEAKTRELARLRGQMGALLRAQAQAGSNQFTASPPSATNSQSRAASNAVVAAADWVKRSTDQFIESQIERARARLSLTPQQESAVREVVNQSMKTGGDNLRKVLTGEAKVEDVPSTVEWAKAMEDDILKTLTPEQQASYKKYKAEDVAASARLMANGELISVQNNLGLSMEQQDQVFAVFYDLAARELDPDPETLAALPRHPAKLAEIKAGQKAAALEGILTPAQMETYRKSQEPGLRLLNTIFPQGKK